MFGHLPRPKVVEPAGRQMVWRVSDARRQRISTPTNRKILTLLGLTRGFSGQRGRKPGGLFWTVPIPSDSVEIDLGAGSATFTLNVFETRDFHDFLNSLKPGPSDPVIVSFKVQWGGKVQQFQRRDAANGLRGEFVETRATMEWFASEQDFNFASAPADTSTSVFAVLGEELNGRFF